MALVLRAELQKTFVTHYKLHERTGAENPTKRIKDLSKLFPETELSREINFLTPDEIEKILVRLRKSRSEFVYGMVQFLVHTGLRRSEAFNLKWTDIDRASGFIHIRTSKTGKARIVPLEPQAWEAIKPLKGNGPYIFTSKRGHRFDVDAPLSTFKLAAKRAGIKKRVDLHTLRHSFGSNKIREGWGLKKVSMMLGHADISITSKVYSHLLDGDLKVRDNLVYGANAKPDLATLLGKLMEASVTEDLDAVTVKELSRRIPELEALTGLIQKRMEQSSKNGLRATHMLRGPSGEKISATVEKEKAGDSPAYSDTFHLLKLAEITVSQRKPILGLAPGLNPAFSQCQENAARQGLSPATETNFEPD